MADETSSINPEPRTPPYGAQNDGAPPEITLRALTPPSTSEALQQAATEALLRTPTVSRINAIKDLPSLERIETSNEHQLRDIAKQLVEDVAQARVKTANLQLQFKLLAMEQAQAVEKAEIESQLAHRQVAYLKVKRPQPVAPAHDQDVTKQIHELELHCEALEDMCEEFKREKEQHEERIQSLTEQNALLITRIRENRDHFTRIRERSPATFTTPHAPYTTPRRKVYRQPDATPAHAPFAALIAADQLLSQETTSVPNTPSRYRKGHTRGAQSLNSLKTPKDHLSYPHSIMLTAPLPRTAIESAEREGADRDSTISASEDEIEVQASQASDLATSMLRRNPNAFGARPSSSHQVERSSSLLQAKIFGPVKKPMAQGDNSSKKLKRAYGFDAIGSPVKKTKKEDGVGLGIAT